MPAPDEPLTTVRPWPVLAWGLLAVLAWDASGLDLALAHWVGTPTGFAWQNHPLLSEVLHRWARAIGWVVLLCLTALAIKPMGWMTTLSGRERGGMVVGIWLALLTVVVLKGISRTSCPWDLEMFGSTAPYLSHWAWSQSDGGPGHCFPAGHASTGFAFVAGYFWLRPRHPVLARRWLWGALTVGTTLGLAQQIRGAHFMSHTLWTAWLCGAIGAAVWKMGASKHPGL